MFFNIRTLFTLLHYIDKYFTLLHSKALWYCMTLHGYYTAL